MVRTQIQLTEEQVARLKKELARERISMAEAIRQALDLWLMNRDHSERVQRLKALRAAAGSGHSGLHDVGRNHDQYLEEIYLER